jgi:hypothetical protein
MIKKILLFSILLFSSFVIAKEDKELRERLNYCAANYDGSEIVNHYYYKDKNESRTDVYVITSKWLIYSNTIKSNLDKLSDVVEIIKDYPSSTCGWKQQNEIYNAGIQIGRVFAKNIENLESDKLNEMVSIGEECLDGYPIAEIVLLVVFVPLLIFLVFFGVYVCISKVGNRMFSISSRR